MTEAVAKILENSVLVKRDPNAYMRFKHNMERSKKYGPGQRMDLDMKPPKPERIIKIQFSDEQCRMLADWYHELMEMGLVPCGEEEENEHRT